MPGIGGPAFGKQTISFAVLSKVLAYRRQHVDIVAWYAAQELRKDRDFFVQTFVFVDQEE